jgi:serine/threonine-protein kinase
MACSAPGLRVTPATIGKYRVLEVLGRGAMGEVYLGEDPLLGRRVAIKVMRGANEELAERFLHEARIVANLSHPNIVGLLEYGFEAGEPFFAMEYLPGQSLDAWRKQHHSLGESLRVVEGLLAALAHAHASGVLHRDVKPSNVQVMPDGSAKLMDFGIAHTDAARLTATGAVMGTPAYMAPEVVAGEACTVRSDLYAAGVLLYELLAGKNPFEGPSVAAVLSKVLHSTPPPLRELRPGLPAELGDLVERCLARDPAQRPAAVAAVLAEIQRLRGAAEAGGAAPLETLALGPAATLDVRPGPTVARPGPVAPVPPPARSMLPATAIGLVLALVAAGAWWLGSRQEQPVAAPLPSAVPATAPSVSPASPTTTLAPPPEAAPSAAPRATPRPAAATPPTTQPRQDPAPTVAPLATPAPTTTTTTTLPPTTTTLPAPAPTPAPTLAVTPAPVAGPRLESIAPGSLRRGSSARLEIRGTGFRADLKVVVLHGRRPAVGIMISRQHLAGGVITCTVEVDGDVPLDAYSIVLVGPDGSTSNGLTLEVTL